MIKIASWVLNVIGIAKEDLAKMHETRVEMDKRLDTLLSDDSQSCCTLIESEEARRLNLIVNGEAPQ